MSLSPPTSEGLGKRLKLTKAHRITQLHSKGTKHCSPQLLAQSLCLASAKFLTCIDFLPSLSPHIGKEIDRLKD